MIRLLKYFTVSWKRSHSIIQLNSFQFSLHDRDDFFLSYFVKCEKSDLTPRKQ